MANQIKKYCFSIIWLCIIFMAYLGCAPLIGPNSPKAYENATSLKAMTLALMDKATEPYADHREDVENAFLEMAKAYEYVNGLPSNHLSVRQWDLLRKNDGNLFGKFVIRWKERSVLSETVISEYKGLVSDAFNEIICLEANKKEASNCFEKGDE